MIFVSRESTGKTSRATDQSTLFQGSNIYLWFDVSHNTFKHMYIHLTPSLEECWRPELD